MSRLYLNADDEAGVQELISALRNTGSNATYQTICTRERYSVSASASFAIEIQLTLGDVATLAAAGGLLIKYLTRNPKNWVSASPIGQISHSESNLDDLQKLPSQVQLLEHSPEPEGKEIPEDTQ